MSMINFILIELSMKKNIITSGPGLPRMCHLMIHFICLLQDTLIEKLRLKNSTLKVQKKKLHLQLKQVR